MKKCCFIGIDSICDPMLGDTLYKELEQIIQTEQELEFWFEHIYSFRTLGLLIVLRLKSQYPHKNIQVVRIYGSDERPYQLKHIMDFGFPACIVDKRIYADLSSERVHNLKRWVLRNCDYIFTYTYPLLAESTMSRHIDYAKKLPGSKVISVSFDETNRMIKENCALLNDRHQTILQMLDEGKTQGDIRDVLGLSTTRVAHLIHDSRWALRATLNQHAFKISKPHVCALTGLHDNPSAIHLIAFENLLRFLIDTCHVRQFWIDKKHWNHAYGAVLINLIAVNTGVSASVMVCADDDKHAWEHTVEAYEPFYSGIIALASDSTDTVAMYAEIIRQCDCFVFDSTCNETETDLIRELCAQNRHITLLDVACDTIFNDQ